MPQITKIEEQRKLKNRVNIYIDGEFSFGLSSQLLIDYDLFKGKELSPEEIERIKEGDSLTKCLSKAYRFLSYRPRSEKEMRDKLLEKFDPQTVDRAISRLEEFSYVNDSDFARMWVNSRGNGRSNRAIAYELKKKGVAPETIEESLAGIGRSEEFRAALELVQSRSKYRDLSKEEAFKKVGGFLSRRGYSYEIIKKVIEELNY